MSLADKLAKKNEEQIQKLTKHFNEKKDHLNYLLEETQKVSYELTNLQKQLNANIDKQLNLINRGGNPFKYMDN